MELPHQLPLQISGVSWASLKDLLGVGGVAGEAVAVAVVEKCLRWFGEAEGWAGRLQAGEVVWAWMRSAVAVAAAGWSDGGVLLLQRCWVWRSLWTWVAGWASLMAAGVGGGWAGLQLAALAGEGEQGVELAAAARALPHRLPLPHNPPPALCYGRPFGWVWM